MADEALSTVYQNSPLNGLEDDDILYVVRSLTSFGINFNDLNTSIDPSKITSTTPFNTDIQSSLNQLNNIKFSTSGGTIGGSVRINGSLGVNTNGSNNFQFLQTADTISNGLTVQNSTELNSLNFWSTASNSFIYSADGSGDLTLNSTGNVGIGVNPLTTLDILGSFRIQSQKKPASGTGLELSYNSGTEISSVERPSGNLQNLDIFGASLSLFSANNESESVPSFLLTPDGNISTNSTVTVPWGGGLKGISLSSGGANIAGSDSSSTAFQSANVYFDGTDWRYINDGPGMVATLQGNGIAAWFTAPVGTGGTVAALTQVFQINQGLIETGALKLGTLSTGVSTTVDGNTEVVFCTAAGITITPSSLISVEGRKLTIKDSSGNAQANPIIITPQTTTVDGSPSVSIVANYGSITIVHNGTEWGVI